MSDLNVNEENLPGLQDDEASPEELDSQVIKAQEQLLMLKRQQDSIEKQKQELEELSRKQGELESGKSEMVESLNRAIVVIERESYEAHKRYEQLNSTRDSFLQHLDILEAIKPKNWDKSDLHKELSKGLSAVDNARSEYLKCRSRVNADAPTEVIEESNQEIEYAPVEEERDFTYWLKAGAAFTLPLTVVLAVIALILFLVGSGS